MDWLSALEPLLPKDPRGCCVAFAGAGGKTTALFALAEAARGSGAAVILTTTTALRDPRSEADRSFDSFILEPALSRGEGPLPASFPARFERPSVTVVSTGLRAGGKVLGVDPSRCAELKERCDFLLVEADGSRGLPIKAYGPGEPVIPACAEIVVVSLGLESLGKAATASLVHRLPAFLALTGLTEGDVIRPRHIAALALSACGLLSAAPLRARRVLCLTKRDLIGEADLEALLTALFGGNPSSDPVQAGGFDLLLVTEGPTVFLPEPHRHGRAHRAT